VLRDNTGVGGKTCHREERAFCGGVERRFTAWRFVDSQLKKNANIKSGSSGSDSHAALESPPVVVKPEIGVYCSREERRVKKKDGPRQEGGKYRPTADRVLWVLRLRGAWIREGDSKSEGKKIKKEKNENHTTKKRLTLVNHSARPREDPIRHLYANWAENAPSGNETEPTWRREKNYLFRDPIQP